MRDVIQRKPLFAMTVAAFALAYFFYFRLASKPPIWPALVDVVFSLPLLYYFMFRPAPRQLLTAWLTIATVGLMGCRLLNPAPDSQLEQYSVLLLAVEVGCELCLLVLLLRRCRKLLRVSGNVDDVMAGAFGNKLVLFEARIWYYALFLRQGERLVYRGEQHFRYDLNNGNASNQFGFIMAMVFEMPLSHLTVHFMAGSPALAWGLDLLTLWGLLYFVAEYRATRWRPISLDHDALIIRNGVLAGDRTIPYSMIESVSRCSDGIRRQRGILRYRQIGQLNVRIDLREGSCLPNLWGRRQSVSSIYLSLDKPVDFIDALRMRLWPQGSIGTEFHSTNQV